MPVATDNQERAAKRVNGMKVAVSRMLTRANNLIENAAIGVFPSIQPIKNEIEYSTTQVIRMFEDVADGWRPLFDPNDKLIVHERDVENQKLDQLEIKK